MAQCGCIFLGGVVLSVFSVGCAFAVAHFVGHCLIHWVAHFLVLHFGAAFPGGAIVFCFEFCETFLFVLRVLSFWRLII